MIERKPTIPAPADVRAWIAVLSAIGAGALTFVQSDRWELATLALIGFCAVGLLAVFVLRRLGQVESEVHICRESHARCDDKVAAAHTAIAVLHERLRSKGEPLPRLSDLLGSDAISAMMRADEVRTGASNSRVP